MDRTNSWWGPKETDNTQIFLMQVEYVIMWQMLDISFRYLSLLCSRFDQKLGPS